MASFRLALSHHGALPKPVVLTLAAFRNGVSRNNAHLNRHFDIMTTDQLKPIIESLIFVSEEPIGIKQLGAILEGHDPVELEAACGELMEQFNSRNSGLEIRQVAGGYKITTRP